MSAILSIPLKGKIHKVFFIYNFRQVNNAVIIVLFNQQSQHWEKFTVYHSNDHGWEIDSLEFVNERLLNEIHRKLESIFEERNQPLITSSIETNKAIEEEAAFLLQLDA